MTSRYEHSLELSARAERSIPLGSQTLAKKRILFLKQTISIWVYRTMLLTTYIVNPTNIYGSHV